MLVADNKKREKMNDLFWNYTQKSFYSCFSNICSTSKAWKMSAINIIFWLINTMKITMIYINEKLLFFWFQMSWRREKRNDIFWNYTQKSFYSCVSKISSTTWKMPVINIIFWLIYTMKTTIIHISEKLLLFVGFRCHEEGKRGIISFESLDIPFLHICMCIYIHFTKLCVLR